MTEIELVSDRLTQEGLRNPSLRLLVPDEHCYSVLYLQRRSTLVATTTSVKNEDGVQAHAECSHFLHVASNLQADLAIAPEYCCPWSTVESAISNGTLPASGALWVIGCESVTHGELELINDRLPPDVVLIHDAPDAGEKRFLDPVAYVFRTHRESGESVIAVLIQFKTHPMAEPINRLELDNLICGHTSDRFQNDGDRTIRLLTLLCSDSLALALPENAQLAGQIGQIDQLLVLHLQLNPKPRDPVYAHYRYALLQSGADREIFAGNWAAGTTIKEGENTIRIAESISALYFHSDELKCEETRFASNHRRGAYPAYIGSCRSFAYILNFEPLLFHFRSTKASQVGAQPQARAKTGMEMLGALRFDAVASEWQDAGEAPDMCDAVFSSVPDHIPSGRAQPINTERLVLLSCGRVERLDATPKLAQWPQIEVMQSCRLAEGTEALRRLTFGQDQAHEAKLFRAALIDQFAVFEDLRSDPTSFPDRLADFRDESTLEFDAKSPTTNVRNREGRRAYLGYLGAGIQNESVAERLHEFIRQHLSRTEKPDYDKILIWYRDRHMNLRSYPRPSPPTISREEGASNASITSGGA